MPKAMKICKVCGKEYEACHTPNPGIFRWRDVACSPECAQKYIYEVMVARGEIEKPEAEATNAEAATTATAEAEPNANADNAADAYVSTAVAQTSRQSKSKKK